MHGSSCIHIGLSFSGTETFLSPLIDLVSFDAFQVLTAIGNFCICSIAIGMFIDIIVMISVYKSPYRTVIDNLLVLLIGGIPIAMPTVLSVTMAIGSHRLSQQVGRDYFLMSNFVTTGRIRFENFLGLSNSAGCHN